MPRPFTEDDLAGVGYALHGRSDNALLTDKGKKAPVTRRSHFYSSFYYPRIEMINPSRKWKYATIGLAAILVMVVTTPAAYAAEKSHQDIMNAINNAVTNLTNLINGKASQTSVNTLQTTANQINAKLPSSVASTTDITTKTYGTQVVRAPVRNLYLDDAGPSFTITSNKDFTACYVAQNMEDSLSHLFIQSSTGVTGTGFINLGIGPNESISGCLGGNTGDTILFEHGQSTQEIIIWVTVTTSSDGTVTLT